MVRKLIGAFFILILVSLGIFVFLHVSKVNKDREFMLKNIKDVVAFLNTLDELPYPKGNLILLDKNFKVIHLKDRNQPLDIIPNLYVIQWNLCSLLEDYPNLSWKVYDPKFSTGNNKKCLTYSVTKDRRYFQIWAILYDDEWNYVSYITGNYKSWSIIKDYASDYLVKNWDYVHFPYAPNYNFEIVIKRVKWSFTVTSVGDCYVVSWSSFWYIVKPTKSILSNCSITFKWRKFVGKVVYPDWSLQMVYPSKNGITKFVINFYDYNWIVSKKVEIVNLLGKMAYSLVKFGENSDVKFKDNNWNYLIIRGTKFSFDSKWKESFLFLAQWSIDVVSRLGKIYSIIEWALKWFNFKKIFDLNSDTGYRWEIGSLVANIIAFDKLIRNSSNFDIEDKISDWQEKFSTMSKPISILFDRWLVQLEGFYNLIVKGKKSRYWVVLLNGKILRPDQIFSGKGFNFIKEINSNKILDDMCQALNYKESVWIDDMYNFIEKISIKQWKLYFDVIDFLKSKIKDEYLVVFKNNFRNSFLNFTFYEPVTKRIWYWPLTNKDLSWKVHNYKWLVLICK